MSDPATAATHLFEGLEDLGRGLPDEGTRVPTVKVTLEDGTTFEVFRAERVPGSVVAWRVRGFTDDGVRLGAILGTKDGRAMLTTTVEPDDAAPALGGLVLQAEPADRDIADLSEAIAAAIRGLMGG